MGPCREKCSKCRRYHKGPCNKRIREENEGNVKDKNKLREDRVHFTEVRNPQGDDSGDEYYTYSMAKAAEKKEDDFDTTYSNNEVYSSIEESSWNDEKMSCAYDWLGDTATTSHISNQRDIFIDFTLDKTNVYGLGHSTIKAKGRGTVEIESIIDGKAHRFKLNDVLYIPENPSNLFALGTWDRNGNY